MSLQLKRCTNCGINLFVDNRRDRCERCASALIHYTMFKSNKSDKSDNCPDCDNRLSRQEGCCLCHACGYSACG